MTLSTEEFEQWCRRLGLSDQAKAVITHIRTSPPARYVQSSAGNVSGTYPSIKMGCAIQFESHRDELPFVYLMDHDPQVLEFYDQPYSQLKLKYRNQDDTRNVTATHTPDFFVLREDGAGWGIPPAPATPLMVTVGGIGEKYAVTDGQIALRGYLSLTISFDHDIVDGAPAARFTGRLKELIEIGHGLFDSTVEPEQNIAEGAVR